MSEVHTNIFEGLPSQDAYRRACAGVGLVLGKLRIRGQDLPAEPAVYVASHRSRLDPIVLAKAIFDQTDRPTRFAAKEELFRFPPFRQLITTWGAIPISRETGKMGGGLRSVIDTSRRGQNVAIFAEGGIRRGSQIGEIYGGVLAIAGLARRPIMPVGIAGVNPLERGRVTVAFGEAIEPEEVRDLRREKEFGLSTLRGYMQSALDEAGQ